MDKTCKKKGVGVTFSDLSNSQERLEWISYAVNEDGSEEDEVHELHVLSDDENIAKVGSKFLKRFFVIFYRWQLKIRFSW